MKTIFDAATRDELISRIHSINGDTSRQWGKMTTYQMLRHCTLWDEMLQGEKKYKQAFIGRLFGKMALRNLLKDDRPLTRNTPTITDLKVQGDGDLEAEKAKWIASLKQYAHYSNPDLVHPFFGKMNREQVGYLVYKHTDHHLRQFGC